MTTASLGEERRTRSRESATLESPFRIARCEPRPAVECDHGRARIQPQSCPAVIVEVLRLVDLNDPGGSPRRRQHQVDLSTLARRHLIG
jgi:hypothetical protein